MQVMKFEELRAIMTLSRNGLYRLIKDDPTFPRPIKYSSSRQGNLYFKVAEVEAWLEKKKCESM
ncbi:hypothetical protein C3420_16700 [Acinetobacter sp. ACNIH3]|jgi:prophage regulatory protein|nr:hypothetical protein C3420_16700 [Acinetobacter sp. ACNIH3]POV72132.1 hypothetical protein C3421_16600 [Acinetobacter sp. ACNIH4]